MIKNRDLVIIFFWAITAFLVVLATDTVLLRTIIAVPLLLGMSGHAFLRVLGFKANSLVEYILYSIGTSIALCVIGGFVLYAVSFLTPLGWAGWLVTITGLALVITRYRQPDTGRTFAVSLPAAQPWHRVVVGVAVLIATSAYLLSAYDESVHREFKYTEFWLLPKSAPGQFLIGIKSAEAQPMHFDIEVVSDGSVVAQWNDIQVDPGKIWMHDVSIGADRKRADAKLYRTDDHAVYRKVSALTGN